VGTKNKKNLKKLDLLEMSNSDRTKLINEAKEKLRRTVIEAKLWQVLSEVENLAVNGKIVYNEKQQLSGFCMENTI
jgi:predicted lipase